MLVYAKAFDLVVDAFKKDGPNGSSKRFSSSEGVHYEAYEGHPQMIGNVSAAMHRKHFIYDFMPLIPDGLFDRLGQRGLRALNVGCGVGFHVSNIGEGCFAITFLAEHCPDSHLRIST